MNGQNNLLSIWYGPAYGFLYIQYHQHLCISPRSDVPQRRIFYRLFYSFRTTVLSALVRLSLYDSYSIVSRIFVFFFLWIVFQYFTIIESWFLWHYYMSFLFYIFPLLTWFMDALYVIHEPLFWLHCFFGLLS